MDHQRLQGGGKVFSPRRPIETGHHPDLGVLKRGHDLFEIVGWNANITVADHQQVIPGALGQGGQDPDLLVRCTNRTDNNQSDIALWKGVGELFDDRHCRIFLRLYPKQYLIGGVVLMQET